MSLAEALLGSTALTQPVALYTGKRPALVRSSPTVVRPSPVMDHFEALTRPAFERLVRNMEGYGNKLSEAHREALMCIVARFTMMAAGTSHGRFAYDLPCGGGKTQAVVAWCAELWHKEQPYSVAVCASRVEPLCCIKRQLIKNGVPDEAIGLVHSYSAEKASLPSTRGNDQKKILLVTHEKVRRGKDIGEINQYRGGPRNLVIWDESLLVSEHRAVEKVRVEQGLGYLKPLVANRKASDALKAAVEYLEDAWPLFDAEFDRQRTAGAKPRSLSLPEVAPEDLARMIEGVPDKEATKAVRTLLTISQSPLRAVAANQGGGGVIKYQIAVPKELKNVAVLDASWAIRDLEKLDQSIKDDPNFNGDVKRHSKVTIHQLLHASGRDAMTKDFSQSKRNRKVSKEVAEVVKTIPEDEGILVFTFKRSSERGAVDMADVLQSDLKADGVKIDAKLKNGKPRFVWLTWGQETAVSDYQYCPNVVFAGVLHRADVDLAGAMVGQQNNLTADLPYAEIAKVRRSEIAHSIYQGLSRSACRNTIDGEAVSTKVWLIHYDVRLRKLIDTVMPGAVWKEWEPEYLAAKTSKIVDAAKRLREYLAGLPQDVLKVSFKKAAGVLNLGLHPNTMALAREEALSGLWGWDYQGRSFVRVENS